MNVQLVLLVNIAKKWFFSLRLFNASPIAVVSSTFFSLCLLLFSLIHLFFFFVALIFHSLGFFLFVHKYFPMVHRFSSRVIFTFFFAPQFIRPPLSSFDKQIIYSDHVYDGLKFELHCDPFSPAAYYVEYVCVCARSCFSRFHRFRCSWFGWILHFCLHFIS